METFLTLVAAWLAAAIVVATIMSTFARTVNGERRALSDRTRRRRRATRAQAVLLIVALGLAASQSQAADWQPLALVCVLAALALATDALPLAIGRYRFTGAFVAIVLAMALLGPAPAVAIGLACVAVDAVRSRPQLGYLLNNFVAYAVFPLVGGMVLSRFEGALPLAVACVVVAVAVNLLNFLIIAGHARMRDGDPLGRAVRHAWLPVLPWEVATGLVAGATVYGYGAVGPGVVAGFAMLLAVLQIAAARIAAASSDPVRHILKTP